MFLKFESNEQRRAYGGSCFIEIQHCKMPPNAEPSKVVSVDELHHWELSSLYIFDDDMGRFYDEYKDILGEGLYNNQNEGALDCSGINYYDREKTIKIIERLKKCDSEDSVTFLSWLMDGCNHNGFYILGV